MSALPIPFPFLPFPFLAPRNSAKALRIDVHLNPANLQDEINRLYERLSGRGPLVDLPVLDIGPPGLVFRHREADGTHYVYVEDAVRRQLAGYTVFNRLVELNRRADRELRAPHSKYSPAYQRRGIATAVYSWWLGKGGCLISGARQSPGAHALWHSLAKSHDMFYVDLRDKQLTYLGQAVSPEVRENLHTRMVLLARDRNMASLADATGMQVPGRLHPLRGRS